LGKYGKMRELARVALVCSLYLDDDKKICISYDVWLIDVMTESTAISKKLPGTQMQYYIYALNYLCYYVRYSSY